jgi:hypothetical protein
MVLISSPCSITGILKRSAKFIGLPPESTEYFIHKIGENIGRLSEALNVAELIKSVNTQALIIHDKNDLEVPYSDAVAIRSLVSTTGFSHRLIIRQASVWQSIVNVITSQGSARSINTVAISFAISAESLLPLTWASTIAPSNNKFSCLASNTGSLIPASSA